MPEAGGIILFDGTCAMCNASVGYVIAHDPAGYFRFAASESPAGQALLREHGLGEDRPRSMLLIEGGRIVAHSTAVLGIARHLRGPARAACVLRLIPVKLRDWAYRQVATRRHRFTKATACRAWGPEVAGRFIG